MRRRSILVDILSIAFGVGAWVAINGIWVELPLLVNELPEGWSLPSYLSVIIQIANIGPITYSVLKLLKPSIGTSKIIYGVLAVGSLASFLLSIFWKKTSVIGQNEHSTSLLVLVFFLSLVDCTSSVLYIPYMANWKEIYLSSYLIGEGLSGLLPALVALAQGTGGKQECQNITHANVTYLALKPVEPNFSIDIFFYLIFIMMSCSTIGYIILQFLPNIQIERTSKKISGETTELKEQFNLVSEKISGPMTNTSFAVLLILQGWSSSLSNGFMPSIQSYSCGPYGNIAYHLAATLSALANPLAALSTMILPRATTNVIGFICLIACLVGIYPVFTAIMSPSPPFMFETFGIILVVISWIIFIGLITYVRVEIANVLRNNGKNALFWSGIVTQAGSAFGASLAFILVNYTKIFVSYNPCNLSHSAYG